MLDWRRREKTGSPAWRQGRKPEIAFDGCGLDSEVYLDSNHWLMTIPGRNRNYFEVQRLPAVRIAVAFEGIQGSALRARKMRKFPPRRVSNAVELAVTVAAIVAAELVASVMCEYPTMSTENSCKTGLIFGLEQRTSSQSSRDSPIEGDCLDKD